MEINKVFFTIIILIVILIITFVFVLPKYKEFSNLQNSLAKKQAEYDGKLIYYSRISELIKNIESKKDALEKIDSALPSNFAFAPIVYFLHKKGDETGLIVKSVVFSQVSATTPEQKVRNVTFNVNALGNYRGLKNFISSLDKSARLFEVNSISFSSQDSSSSSSLQNIKDLKNQGKLYDFQLVVQTNTY